MDHPRGNVFTPRANLLLRLTVLGAGLVVCAAGVLGYALTRSAYSSQVGRIIDQPVPFSHAHHAGALGIDCRFCHTTVEDQGFAGMPTTDTCMKCHWQLWTTADVLAPVRKSWLEDTPIRWVRVHDLPDHTRFDHAAHTRAGVGCASCHGRVDRMPLTRQVETLFMEWCLECHRDPGPHLRPRDRVFDMGWQPPSGWSDRGRELARQRGIQPERLTSCSICHL